MDESTTLPQVPGMLMFTWLDYTFFGVMLLVSALIGVYYGCFGTRQSTAEEYLLGGKSMGIFPIAMSLVASYLSGIVLLGIPSEIYVYGTQYWICVISAVSVALATNYVFFPVFYKLQLTSSYEYLSLRFDPKLKNLASGIFILATVLHVPLVIYVPAMAFNQVTGVSINVICPTVSIVCILYTTLGGLKAVVWSDTVQLVVTIISMFAVFYMGVASIGDFGTIWERSRAGGRIELFNFDLDPTTRTTFWTISVGLSLTWIAHSGVHPASVQRFLALPSFQHAKKAAWVWTIGLIITKTLSVLSGLIIYATYYGCDPILSGKVRRMDQLLPYYVLDVAKSIPGLPGIFIAGVFNTALSAMSTYLNTGAGIIYADFILPYRKKRLSKEQASRLIKMLVCVLGLFCLLLVILVEKLGGILQIGMIMAGITGGPLLGIFLLGMLVPIANTKGATYGCMSGIILVAWMCVGQQINILNGKLKIDKKPLAIDGCVGSGNSTLQFDSAKVLAEEDLPFWLYRISFYWYTLIGFVVVMVIGTLVSFICKSKDDPMVNKDLLSPIIYRFLRDREEGKLIGMTEFDKNNTNEPLL